jgi:P4 family phage/plasmid primase-like protien
MSFYEGPIYRENPTPSKELNIKELYEIIKSDRYKPQILSMRSCSSDDEFTDKKKKLDYVTPAGVFKVRNNDGILEYSGYAPIDIDKIDAEPLNELKNKLKEDEYISLLFTSPSGKGLKAIIKIPWGDDYKEYVEGFYNYLHKRYCIDIENLDKKTKDISRACFVSYDPEAHYNPGAELFYQKAKKPTQKQVIPRIKKETEPFVFDFLLNYCTNNKLPEGERNNTIEKNLAILIRDKEDRTTIIEKYIHVQNQPPNSLNGWISNDKYCEVNVGEIVNYIKRNKINFDIPEFFDIDKLESNVKLNLALHKTTEATESIVQFFLRNNKVYTTRDDKTSEVWIYRDGIYIPQGKTYITEFVREVTKEAFTTYFCNQVIAKLEADTYIDQDVFFNSWTKDEIIVLNGILNLETRELSEYTQDKIFFNKLPVIYDETKDCPNIRKHFESVLRYKDDTQVLFELFGFLLWKEYFIEKAAMFSGSGRNGKSKTVELMKRFIGVENCTNIPLQQLENDRFALGELFNKMANLSPDLSPTALTQTGIFKALRGRDELTADRKFKARVKFVNHAKMIFCANELPKTHDTTEAFWNSWILLEFPYTFLSKKEMKSRTENEWIKEADVNIIEKLTTPNELSGLLNRALDGLDQIRSQKDFSYSKNTEEVKRLWIKKSDSFMAFFMDCCEKKYGEYVFKDKLGEAYSKYCMEKELKPMGTISIKNTLSMQNVWEERKPDGYDDDGKNKVYRWAWCNLRLSTDWEIEKKKQKELQSN